MSGFLSTIADFVIATVVRALIVFLALIPYERRMPMVGRWLAGWLGRVTGYRRKTLQNIALVYPDITPQAREALVVASLDNLGRAFFEMFDPAGFARQLDRSSISGPGLAAIAQAKAEGRPVMFVTGHFGNQDAARRRLTNEGYRINAVFRPMNNRFLNKYYVAMFSNLGGTPYSQGAEGTRGFFKALMKGEWATLMIDVWFGKGPAVDFLGLPAPTSTASADFALRANALYVPYFARRRDDGLTFDITVEAPIPHGDPVDMVAAATARLGAHVQEAPAQWYWVHRRWKTPRP